MSITESLFSLIQEYEYNHTRDDEHQQLQLSSLGLLLIEKFPFLRDNLSNDKEWTEFLNALSVYQYLPSSASPSSISPVVIAAVKKIFSSTKVITDLSISISSWCLIRIEPTILEVCECIPSVEIFQRKLIKANTDLYYRQPRHSLFKECSAGYAQYTTQLLIPCKLTLEEIISSYSGEYDLDPFRCISIFISILSKQFECLFVRDCKKLSYPVLLTLAVKTVNIDDELLQKMFHHFSTLIYSKKLSALLFSVICLKLQASNSLGIYLVASIFSQLKETDAHVLIQFLPFLKTPEQKFLFALAITVSCSTNIAKYIHQSIPCTSSSNSFASSMCTFANPSSSELEFASNRTDHDNTVPVYKVDMESNSFSNMITNLLFVPSLKLSLEIELFINNLLTAVEQVKNYDCICQLIVLFRLGWMYEYEQDQCQELIIYQTLSLITWPYGKYAISFFDDSLEFDKSRDLNKDESLATSMDRNSINEANEMGMYSIFTLNNTGAENKFSFLDMLSLKFFPVSLLIQLLEKLLDPSNSSSTKHTTWIQAYLGVVIGLGVCMKRSSSLLLHQVLWNKILSNFSTEKKFSIYDFSHSINIDGTNDTSTSSVKRILRRVSSSNISKIKSSVIEAIHQSDIFSSVSIIVDQIAAYENLIDPMVEILAYNKKQELPTSGQVQEIPTCGKNISGELSHLAVDVFTWQVLSKNFYQKPPNSRLKEDLIHFRPWLSNLSLFISKFMSKENRIEPLPYFKYLLWIIEAFSFSHSDTSSSPSSLNVTHEVQFTTSPSDGQLRTCQRRKICDPSSTKNFKESLLLHQEYLADVCSLLPELLSRVCNIPVVIEELSHSQLSSLSGGPLLKFFSQHSLNEYSQLTGRIKDVLEVALLPHSLLLRLWIGLGRVSLFLSSTNYVKCSNYWHVKALSSFLDSISRCFLQITDAVGSWIRLNKVTRLDALLYSQLCYLVTPGLCCPYSNRPTSLLTSLPFRGDYEPLNMCVSWTDLFYALCNRSGLDASRASLILYTLYPISLQKKLPDLNTFQGNVSLTLDAYATDEHIYSSKEQMPHTFSSFMTKYDSSIPTELSSSVATPLNTLPPTITGFLEPDALFWKLSLPDIIFPVSEYEKVISSFDTTTIFSSDHSTKSISSFCKKDHLPANSMQPAVNLLTEIHTMLTTEKNHQQKHLFDFAAEPFTCLLKEIDPIRFYSTTRFTTNNSNHISNAIYFDSGYKVDDSKSSSLAGSSSSGSDTLYSAHRPCYAPERDNYTWILEHAIVHRLLLSPADAIFCARWIQKLHQHEWPSCTLLLLDRLFGVSATLLSGLTFQESINFGQFLKLIMEWISGFAHVNPSSLTKESCYHLEKAYSSHGCKIGFSLPLISKRSKSIAVMPTESIIASIEKSSFDRYPVIPNTSLASTCISHQTATTEDNCLTLFPNIPMSSIPQNNVNTLALSNTSTTAAISKLSVLTTPTDESFLTDVSAIMTCELSGNLNSPDPSSPILGNISYINQSPTISYTPNDRIANIRPVSIHSPAYNHSTTLHHSNEPNPDVDSTTPSNTLPPLTFSQFCGVFRKWHIKLYRSFAKVLSHHYNHNHHHSYARTRNALVVLTLLVECVFPLLDTHGLGLERLIIPLADEPISHQSKEDGPPHSKGDTRLPLVNSDTKIIDQTPSSLKIDERITIPLSSNEDIKLLAKRCLSLLRARSSTWVTSGMSTINQSKNADANSSEIASSFSSKTFDTNNSNDVLSGNSDVLNDTVDGSLVQNIITSPILSVPTLAGDDNDITAIMMDSVPTFTPPSETSLSLSLDTSFGDSHLQPKTYSLNEHHPMDIQVIPQVDVTITTQIPSSKDESTLTIHSNNQSFSIARSKDPGLLLVDPKDGIKRLRNNEIKEYDTFNNRSFEDFSRDRFRDKRNREQPRENLLHQRPKEDSIHQRQKGELLTEKSKDDHVHKNRTTSSMPRTPGDDRKRISTTSTIDTERLSGRQPVRAFSPSERRSSRRQDYYSRPPPRRY